MSIYGNFVCECGNFYSSGAGEEDGRPYIKTCKKCRSAEQAADVKSTGTWMVIGIGLLTALVVGIYSKFNATASSKAFAIKALIFFISFLIIAFGGFFGIAIVIASYFGWKWINKNKATIEASEVDTEKEIVKDDASSK